MATFSQGQIQKQKQSQKQRLSQLQLQGISFLAMDSLDLRQEILNAVNENPALKIKTDMYAMSKRRGTSSDGEKLQRALENTEDYAESLQAHLLHQLNSIALSEDELHLSEKLIYNLDENGCYGSSLSPEFLLDKSRPAQTPAMLSRCIDRIQRMDPVGTCCKTPEESLLVQAKISGDAPALALFLLDGHLEFLNPPEPARILRKVTDFSAAWHKKAFAPKLPIDGLELNTEAVEQALSFILKLNPRPAQGYSVDSISEYNQPDVVAVIKKVPGQIQTDYAHGVVSGLDNFHFQITYASGVLPELELNTKISRDVADEYAKFQKECVQKAKEFLDALKFRESTVILQTCAIVNAQKNFFADGAAPINLLTRRQIARELQIHESTVSRVSSKKNSKFFQTEYGLIPVNYFFTSGVATGGGEKVSSNQVKAEMKKLMEQNGGENLSDQKLSDLLMERNIKVSRRTVAKYRQQLGIKNSYIR